MKKQGMMPTKSASTMQPPSPPPAGIAKGIGDGSLADPSTEKMHMSKGEMCKACGMAKSKDHDCDMAEKYAKGELTKGMMPAGAGGPTIGPTPGVLPDDKKPKKEGGDEGSGGDMKKAGFMGSKPPGGPAAGAMGAPPAGGGMPKMPKLPGVGKPAGAGAPKPPGGALPMPKAGPMSGPVPKTPALGAGSPAAKAELQKLDPTWSPHSKPTGPMPTPAFAPEPGVASLNPGKAKSQNLTGKAPPNQVDAIAPMAGAKPAAPAGLPPVISSAPAPGAAPAHGSLVGQTLTGSMGLPPGPGAITGLGAKPAQGVKTMTERVAAKVPPPIPAAAKGHSLSHLTSPPAAARPAPPQAAAPSLGGKKA
jgi:hypothetical protein